MSVMQWVREDLRKFAGYSSARKEAQGGRILLNANESPWTVAGDAIGLNRYPEPQPAALSQRLAQLYGVAIERLLIGRGSDELIDLLVRALCRAGRDSVLISPPTFGMYAVCARVQDAAILSVPLRAENDFTLDVDAVLAAVTDSTRIVFACSPNNPTGNSIAADQLRRLALGLQQRALLVVDEAYAEFSAAESAIALSQEFEHVAVLRTLSKAYALAGARIGSVIADPELIRVLRSIMAPYPLPAPCVAAALNALSPGAIALARSRIGLIKEERHRMSQRMMMLPGVTRVWPSDANFLLVELGDAGAVYRQALAAGIVLRAPSEGQGLDACLRISIGTPEENDVLLDVLQSMQEAA